MANLPTYEGKDRFGLYYNLSGREAEGKCFWCGTDVSGRRRYCCHEHRDSYHEHFFWPSASRACLERGDGKCGDCGKELKWASDFRVHHIVPLNGASRTWNVLNRPENLIALCASCHGIRHSNIGTYNHKGIMKVIRLNQKEILPRAGWLEKHLLRFPNGILPEQKIEVKIDGKHFLTATTKAGKGDIKKAMEGAVK